MSRPADRSLTPRDPLIGRVLDERYRVLRRIGKGGMGNVYLAEHVLIGRKVAIKTLHETLCNPELIERFHREARAAAAIGNDHIVDVTDMGALESGAYYLVLEYLEGADLAFRVASQGPLEVGAAVGLMLQLCAALRAVHAAGIVHRDLKPDNLFLIERDGSPDFLKVLDFGVCKFREGTDHKRLTATGVALGTPHYMAPEQVEGRSDVDRRADLYAAGGILHFALTGAPPFDGPSMPSLFMQICDEAPKPLCSLRPDAPRELEQIVLRALAKRREDRYQDAAQLLAALQSVSERLSGAEPSKERNSMHEGETLPAFDSYPRADATLPGRRRWPLRLTAAAIGTGLALGAAQLMQGADHPRASTLSVPRPRPADTSLAPATEPVVQQGATRDDLPLGAAPPPITQELATHQSSAQTEPASRQAPAPRRARTRAAAAASTPATTQLTERTPPPASDAGVSAKVEVSPAPPASHDPAIVPHGELRPVFGPAAR